MSLITTLGGPGAAEPAPGGFPGFGGGFDFAVVTPLPAAEPGPTGRGPGAVWHAGVTAVTAVTAATNAIA
jgi:hypothetical protein